MHFSLKRIGAGLISVTVLLAAQFSAYATFPGKNGRIAFGRFDPNVGDLALFTANPDGTDVHQLTFVPSLFSDWRADGQRIAFAFIDSDGNEQVGTIKPDGTDFQQITSGSSVHEVGSWSPTGNQIVFTYSAQSPDDPTFTTSVYIMNSDGSNQVQLTNGEGGYPIFVTPDQRSVYFVSALQGRLWRMSLDGRDEVQVSETEVVEPAVSPDGKLAAYLRSKTASLHRAFDLPE